MAYIFFYFFFFSNLCVMCSSPPPPPRSSIAIIALAHQHTHTHTHSEEPPPPHCAFLQLIFPLAPRHPCTRQLPQQAITHMAQQQPPFDTAEPLHSNPVWKEYAWGGLAAAFGESMMHPVDTIKTRMQSGGRFISAAQNSTKVGEMLKLILKNDGLRGLYRGITPGLTGSLATGATYFGFIETAKQFVEKKDPTLAGPLAHFLAGAVGDALGSFIYVPCEVIKQRMQLQGTKDSWIAHRSGAGVSSFQPEYLYYRGLFHAGRSIIEQEGFRGIYTGFGPTLARDVPFAGLLIMFYEILAQRAQELRSHKKPTDMREFAQTGCEDFVMGGVAGGIAAYLTTPLDILKTRLQVQGPIMRYKGWVDALQTIWKDEGIQGFFKGSVPRVIWYVPAYALTFMAWQALRNECGVSTRNQRFDSLTVERTSPTADVVSVVVPHSSQAR